MAAWNLSHLSFPDVKLRNFIAVGNGIFQNEFQSQSGVCSKHGQHLCPSKYPRHNRSAERLKSSSNFHSAQRRSCTASECCDPLAGTFLYRDMQLSSMFMDSDKNIGHLFQSPEKENVHKRAECTPCHHHHPHHHGHCQVSTSMEDERGAAGKKQGMSTPGWLGFGAVLLQLSLSEEAMAAGGLRRHQRRREIAPSDEARTDASGFFATSWNDKSKQSAARRRGGSNANGSDNVSFFIDLNEWRNRASEAAHTAGYRAKRVANRVTTAVRGSIDEVVEAATVLRGSVAVRPGGRIEFSAPRSYLGVAGRGLATLVAASLVAIWLIRKVAHYFWWNGMWGQKGAKDRGVTVRDRSLGGREVFVGATDMRTRPGGVTSSRRVDTTRTRGAARGRIISPLDDVEPEARSEKVRNGAGTTRRRQVALPSWWPREEVVPMRTPEVKEAARVVAQALMRRMIDNRTVGLDFSIDDILELRRMCRENGVSVVIETGNTRDALYREAVHLALNACTNKGGLGLGTEGLGPLAPARFVAGLADNIGLERTRAATMVNAAVAARTRSALMQAFAYLAQRKEAEATEELGSLVRVHEMFPAAPGSAEMEMVAGGLASRWSKEERERLCNLYVAAGGEATESIGAEALGLGMLVK